MIDIQVFEHEHLPGDRRPELAVAAGNEFDRFPIVRETRWAVPDWSVLGIVDDRLACFYNIVLRTVCFDGRPARVAGLNNLVTLPDYKGKGYASHLLRETEPLWFGRLGAAYGLLLCADALLPFYERLGWYSVSSAVRFAQPGGMRTWAANCMLLAPHGRRSRPTEIDLQGLPW